MSMCPSNEGNFRTSLRVGEGIEGVEEDAGLPTRRAAWLPNVALTDKRGSTKDSQPQERINRYETN